MPSIAMTERWLAKLQGQGVERVDWFDARADGLVLRVGPRRRTWYALYRPRGSGKLRRVRLGEWPHMELAAARRQAAITTGRVAGGADPAAERAAERAGKTFAELASDFLERGAAGDRTFAETRRVIAKNLLPAWAGRKAREITRRDVIELTDAIVDRGAPVAANRVFSLVRRMFNWGIRRAIVEANPCALMDKPGGEEVSRERVLSAAEIQAFWTGLDAISMAPATRAALRLVLVTAQRPGEVAGVSRSELDRNGGWWVIPGVRAKNAKPHTVPLSALACELIDSLPAGQGDFLFESPRLDESEAPQPIRRHALGRALARGWEKTPEGEPGPFDKLGRFTPHDLRRTGASHMAQLGIERSTIAKVLNHVLGGATAIYDRHSYDPEKKRALEKWGRELKRIVTGEAPAKVVPLRGKARA